MEALRPAQLWSTVTCGVKDETVAGGQGEKLGHCKRGQEYTVAKAAYYPLSGPKKALKLRLEGMEGWCSLNNKKGNQSLFQVLERIVPDTESEDDEEAAELPGTPGKGQVSAVSAEDERLSDELSRRR